MTFVDTSDPGSGVGLCGVAVRYPNEAPGVIRADAITYVQTGRQPYRSNTGAGPGASALGQSGDWTVVLLDPAHVALLTPAARFDYRAAAAC